MTRARRLVLAFVGILLVAVGAVGVVVPGLPTTVFLLGASWCFARSWPWLEERLLKNRFFRPYLKITDRSQPIAPRTRAWILVIMWAAIATSVWGFGAHPLLLAAGAVGSVAVLLYGRGRAAAAG